MRLFLAFLLATQNVFALSNPPSATERQYLQFKNMMTNGGAESGRTGWVGGTTQPTVTTTAADVFDGLRAIQWDPSGADTLRSPSWTPNANSGGNGVGFCRIKTADPDYTFQIFDGTNVINSVAVPAGTEYRLVYLNFPVVGSTSYSVRVASAGDDDVVNVDDCGIGYAEGWNIADISQAEFVGSAFIATTANCTWSRTNTALGAFGPDADCPGPTLELAGSTTATLVTTDTDLPQFTWNNLPPGNYTVITSIGIGGTAANNIIAFTLNDGTTSSGRGMGGNTSVAPHRSGTTIISSFKYDNSGNRTFSVWGSSSTGSVDLTTSSSDFILHQAVYRYPLASQIAVKADTVAQSWSGYHDSTCSWARTNTAYGDPTADASCALVQRTNVNFGAVTTSGSVLPAITWTPSSAGSYYVCANFMVVGSAQSFSATRMVNGATVIVEGGSTVPTAGGAAQHTLCGIVNALSTSAITVNIQTAQQTGSATIQSNSPYTTAISWTVVRVDQAIPAPLIKQSVVTGSEGITRIERVKVASVCSASPCTITSQSGSWVSSLTRAAAGDYTVNINAGVFSSGPSCFVFPSGTASSVSVADSVIQNSTTAFNFNVRETSTGTGTDASLDVMCIGPR